MMRCFLAIELPETVRVSLSHAAARLRSELNVRASWVREENLHITLRFLGELDDDAIDSFSRNVTSHAKGTPSALLRIRGIGVFPNARRAKVLWAGGEGDLDPLRALHANCETAARDLGLDPDHRAWSPHVTLARFKESPRNEVVQCALDAFSGFDAGEFSVSGVTLFSSQLSPHGSIYRPIRKFEFSCPSTSSSEPFTTS